MARFLYTLLFYLLTPLLLLRLLLRSRKAPDYRRRIAERFGFFAAPATGGIWVHAVSVGEAIAAAPLVKALQQQYPDQPITVTTMTPTGSERVKALFGGSVFHVYAPWDMPDAVRRFLNRVQPSLLIVMETELWPNTVDACAKRTIPVVVANARLSAKSAAGYQRVLPLTRPMLQSLTSVVAQHREDAERFVSLGLPRESVTVSGSIKFDLALDADLRQRAAALKQQWSQGGQRPILVAASTHEGEEAIILDAFKRMQQTHPELLLVLVPRHPERFPTVAALCQDLALCHRSKGEAPSAETQVLLGDTMGELLLFYGCADLALVGGSLIERGGHNTLEAAVWGVPILTGPSDFNFLAISQLLQEREALKVVHNADELTEMAAHWLSNPDQARQAGESARQSIEENRGALQRLLELLRPFLN